LNTIFLPESVEQLVGSWHCGPFAAAFPAVDEDLMRDGA
jgi:hypothetical protein